MSDTPPQKPKAESIPPLDDTDVEQEVANTIGDLSMQQIMDETQAVSVNPTDAAGEQAKGSQPPTHIDFETRRGRIAKITGDDVFVTLTGIDSKLQGLVPLKQFERPPRIGSIMDFVVERLDEKEGLVHLSREGAVGAIAWQQLARGSNIEARVTSTNKGGLELEIAGGISAFMPASQIDLHHVEDLKQFISQKVQATVREIDRRGKRVILSRRDYLEIQRNRKRDKLLKDLAVGQTRQGTVTRITDFGAFVDLGGLDGLLHISDMSYSRIEKPQDIVKSGQQITIKVLAVEEEGKRIRLGLKQTAPDPWHSLDARLQVGDQVIGRIVRLENFGAFVELEPGVDGLLPVSEISWKRIGHPNQICKEGEVLKVSVLQIDIEQRRLSLSLKQVHGDPWQDAGQKYAVNQVVEGKVVQTTVFGAFVELENGIEALAHISQLANSRVESVEAVVKAGDTRQFRIIGIEPQDRKISLSIRALTEPLPSSGDHGSTDGPNSADSQEASKSKQKPQKRDHNLKGGMGEHGGMGMGLGNLKL